MQEIVVSLLIFACLTAAGLGALLLQHKLLEHYLNDETVRVVENVATLFVWMTSLVLGLMLNSAANTFSVTDHNMHELATQVVLLDRRLRAYGPEADDARQRLMAYVARALTATEDDEGTLIIGDRVAEQLLLDVGDAIVRIVPSDAAHAALWQDARQSHQKLLESRWTTVEQAEGAIPVPLLAALVAWLILIFGSYGFRAPRNLVVVGSLVVAAGLIAGSIYLVMDMEQPFSGLMQVSFAPLQRALAEMRL
jgi:hypothetical protein